MHEKDHVIENGDVTLAGTLTAPETDQPCPLVICVHGSGPLDRNENVGPQKLNVFNTIAADLARHGIASYRYDKRGCAKSTGDFDSAGFSDFLSDLEAIFDHFNPERSERYSHIVALGHSEGTLLSASLANARPVDGIILIAPFIEPMEKILSDQAKKSEEVIRDMRGFTGFLVRGITKIVGTPTAQQRRVIATVRASDKPVVRIMLKKLQARWLRELLSLSPPKIYEGVKVPSLIIGGTKDIQCNPEDVSRIAATIGLAAEPHLMDNLSHLLRYEPGKASFLGYKDQLKRPMEQDVLDLISGWMARFKI